MFVDSFYRCWLARDARSHLTRKQRVRVAESEARENETGDTQVAGTLGVRSGLRENIL